VVWLRSLISYLGSLRNSREGEKGLWIESGWRRWKDIIVNKNDTKRELKSYDCDGAYAIDELLLLEKKLQYGGYDLWSNRESHGASVSLLS